MASPQSNPTTQTHQPTSSQDRRDSKSPKPARPGQSIMESNDPSTAALRAFAEEKSKHYPGQDGSFSTGYNSGDTMGWATDSWILPHKGDTKLPPGGMAHGEAKVVDGAEGEEKKKRHSFGGLFHKKGKKEEVDVVEKNVGA
ncbi:hypothetical protein MMC28_001984 [Mycoblastus sanguinarius]|nr:hypothetical protein [Mycoblastus sanguinarius]